MLEVEVKIRCGIPDIESKLAALGFGRGSSVYEYDTYFNGRRLDLKEADKALRIREHKDLDTGRTRFVLNFKGPKTDQVTMTREETQFEVPSYEVGETVLTGLEFYPAGYVEKTRIHYQKDDITCCLDTVTGLGCFMEIEIMAEKEDYETAVAKIRDLLEKLGSDLTQTVRKSYLGMLQNAAAEKSEN